VLGVTSADEGDDMCRAEVEADGRYDERRIHVEVHGKWTPNAAYIFQPVAFETHGA